MSHPHKIPLWTAILINLNIMIGVGVFINTIPLYKIAGTVGALSYLAIGILMLPLILSISHLLKIHPAGGFYTFGSRELSPFLGFVSTWSYFVAKLASTAIMTHVSVTFIQELVPFFASFQPITLDCFCIGLFTILNMQNIKTGGILQTIFTTLKLFPLFFLIIGGLLLLSNSQPTPLFACWQTIPSTLPLVLFSMLGFEAACSLSSAIENPEKNASRAVISSYLIAISLYIAYQLIASYVIGSDITTLADYRAIFPTFLAKLLGPHSSFYAPAVTFFHCALASSALSAAYSIMFSNMWNLHIVAHHAHIIGSQYLTRLNRNHIPWLCVIAEAAIALTHLFVTGAAQVPLQVTSALGSTIAYCISALSLLAATQKRAIALHWSIPLLAIINCAILAGSCIYTLYLVGIYALTSFALLFCAGLGMYYTTSNTVNANEVLK